MYKIVENVKFVFGKKSKDGKPRKVVEANEGDVRHAIDGMHV